MGVKKVQLGEGPRKHMRKAKAVLEEKDAVIL